MKKTLLTITSLLTLACASYAQINNHILLHYPLDGNSNDMSNNVIHGVEYGNIMPTTDRFGNINSAFEFDGIDDYIRIPHDTIYKTNLPKTVSLWVEANDSSVINQIFKTDNDSSRYYGYNLNSSNGKFSASIMNGAGAGSQYRNTFVPSNTYNSNIWHHVVVVYNAINDIDMYVDGQLSAGGYSGTGSSLVYSTKDGAIGMSYSQFGGTDYYFKGKLDDIMVFDTSLTQSDVTDLFTKQTACAGNYMNFDGVDDRVGVDSVFSGSSSSFTLEARFKSNDGDGSYPRIIGWDSHKIIIAENANGVLCSYDGTWRASSSQDVRDGNWHHAALVIDDNEQRLYLDGNEVLKHVYGGTQSISFNNSSMWIGNKLGGSGSENWKGNIDEVRVWDYARTERQIKENKFGSVSPSEPGLVTYFDFEQSNKMDSVITDVTGNLLGNREGTDSINTFGPRFINSCIVEITDSVCVGSPYTSPSGQQFTSEGDFVDSVSIPEYFEQYTITLSDDNCINNIEENNYNTYSVYPNPVNSILFIKINNNFKAGNYRIFNLLGSEIKSQTISSTNEKINVSDLENGIYLIEISIDDNTETMRFIKK